VYCRNSVYFAYFIYFVCPWLFLHSTAILTNFWIHEMYLCKSFKLTGGYHILGWSPKSIFLNFHFYYELCLAYYNNKSKSICKVKVKQSRNRPGVAQRVPGGLDSHVPGHSALEGGEVVSLTHRPPLPPGNVPATHLH